MRNDYFKNIATIDQAYWLGFLYADGFIGSSETFVRLCLSIKDEEHLDKFILTLEDDLAKKRYYGPYKTSGKQVHYSIYNVDLVQSLITLGCTYKKSYTIRFPKLASRELDLAFLMGYFDGDGCQKTTSITCGSLAFLNDIKEKFQISNSILSQKSAYGFYLGVSLFKEMQDLVSFSMPRKRLVFHQRLNTKKPKQVVARTLCQVSVCICGEPKGKYAKKCFKCREVYKRFDISSEELAKLVWEIPMVQLGERFGVSGNSVKKRCLKFGISFPGSGYWAKKAVGKLPEQGFIPKVKKEVIPFNLPQEDIDYIRLNPDSFSERDFMRLYHISKYRVRKIQGKTL